MVIRESFVRKVCQLFSRNFLFKKKVTFSLPLSTFFKYKYFKTSMYEEKYICNLVHRVFDFNILTDI